jgi:hypothetical protein
VDDVVAESVLEGIADVAVLWEGRMMYAFAAGRRVRLDGVEVLVELGHLGHGRFGF